MAIQWAAYENAVFEYAFTFSTVVNKSGIFFEYLEDAD